MELVSRKLCRFLLMFSSGFTSLSALLLFPQLITFFVVCMVFESISSNIDQVLLINPSANVFVFGDLNVYHKHWLIYFGGTDRSGNFFVSDNLTRMANFTILWFSQSCSFGLISLFWCYYLFYNNLPSIGKFWSCCCLSFHWLPIKFTMRFPVSLHSLWLFSCWLGRCWWSFERCSMWGYL